MLKKINQSHSRNRTFVVKQMNFSSPTHELASKVKNQKSFTDIEEIEERKYTNPLLRGNNYQPCNYFQTSIADLENSRNISVMSEETGLLHDQDLVYKNFKTFCKKFIDKTCFTKEQENLVIKY